jgi:DnaJ-class molecular chaperone
MAKTEPCPICKGEQMITCPNCKGDGKVIRWKYSKVREMDVYDGMKECPTCNGDRRIVCVTCGGSGAVIVRE